MSAGANPPPPLIVALREALRQILAVVAVGVVLATIFTVWTPNTILPSAVAANIAAAVQRVNGANLTATPPAALPTATPALPTIGILSGHKGNDSGAVCPDGLTEAAVNLDIATRVQAGLEASGFHVDLLDEFDPRLSGYRALAVVSIHNDSCAFIDADPPATGYKVAGALDGGARGESTQLVSCLIDRYPKQTGMSFHKGSVTADMTQYHSFYEVDTTTPIAIIETGFLNLDRKILTEEPYRVAQGIIDGILCYVLNEPVAPPAAP